VHGNTITVTLPTQTHDKVLTTKYQTAMAANARLAGLVRKQKDEDGQPLVPLVFAEIRLPQARNGETPRLHSRLPSSHYVFCWDARRRCGYLLVTPRAQDNAELRFHVQWEPAETADAG
jgi:hypothetical protein